MSKHSVSVCLAGLGLAAVLVVGAPAAASPGSERHKWWVADDVRAELGLTDQQSRELESIFQSVRPQLRAGWQELDRLEQEVATLLTEGTTDAARFGAAVDRVESARASLNKTRTLMLFRMHHVLSPDQRVKLRAIHERNRQRKSTSSH